MRGFIISKVDSLLMLLEEVITYLVIIYVSIMKHTYLLNNESDTCQLNSFLISLKR